MAITQADPNIILGLDRFNPAESFQRGRDNRLLGLAQQGQIEAQAQQTELRGVEAERATEDRATEEENIRQFKSIAEGIRQIGPVPTSEEQVPEFIQKLETRRAELLTANPNANTQDTDQTLQKARAGDFQGIQQDFDQIMQLNEQLRAQGVGVDFIAPTTAAKRQTLKDATGRQRFVDTGQPVFDLGDTTANTPSALLEGLTADQKRAGMEAFRLAGGGDKGIKALQDAVKTRGEQTLREDVPQLLRDSFPNASPAEFEQLEAAARAGKTPESGLKSAQTVRVEQRRLKKAQGFQTRAVSLLKGLLTNPELDDVTGSIEGKFERTTSDAEANAIADIEEVSNILTSDNLDLMTGILSDTDIAILRSLAAGGLIRTRGDQRFRKDVQEIINKLESVPVRTVDSGPSRVGQGQADELNALRQELGF